MIRLRPVLAAAAGILFYAATDILVWQRIFEANQMVGYAGAYHTGWVVSLAGYATVGTILMWDRWKDCLYFLAALGVGAFSGLEDVLYYVLDGKPIPASLPWLANNPFIYAQSRTGLITSVLFWTLTLAGLYAVLFIWHRSPGGRSIQPSGPPARN